MSMLYRSRSRCHETRSCLMFDDGVVGPEVEAWGTRSRPDLARNFRVGRQRRWQTAQRKSSSLSSTKLGSSCISRPSCARNSCTGCNAMGGRLQVESCWLEASDTLARQKSKLIPQMSSGTVHTIAEAWIAARQVTTSTAIRMQTT